MIKRVYRSRSDIENLSRLRTEIPNGINEFDYRGVVVNKPWGYEYLMLENSHVSIWVLSLKSNHGTSMHCHPNKKTALIVLSGKVICSTLEGWISQQAGEGILIDEAVFHSTKAISEDGAFIMEVESPPDKKDLVRLKDEYGREHQGYEGEEKMTQELEKYEYVDFHDVDFSRRQSKMLKKCRLSICAHRNSANIHRKLKKESGHLICLLQGKLHDSEGNIVLSTGEIGVLPEIKSKPQIFAFGDIVYLTIHYYGRKSKSC